MKTQRHLLTTFTFLIAGVWLVFGLYCKVLNQVPRHEEIVAQILGTEQAALITRLIGFGEICIAIWVASRLFPILCALFQSALVLAMNVIEQVIAPELLHLGKGNFIVACIFVSVVWLHAFLLKKMQEETANEVAI